MTFADFFWFLFSSGGLIVLAIVAAVWIWTRPQSKAARVFLAALVVSFALFSLYPIPLAAAHALGSGFHPLTPDDVPPGRSAVVLLGSGSYTRRDWSDRTMSVLDRVGLERTLEAARVFRLVQADWIVSSGGRQSAEDTDDPAGFTMKTALVALGVPADRVIVEHESRNTRDEALLVAKMLPSLKVDHLILVTSEVHMRRSVGVFRAVGVSVIPAIAREPTDVDRTLNMLPTETGLRLSGIVVHEIAGLVYYWARGWYK